MAQAGVVGAAEVNMPTTAGTPAKAPKPASFWAWVFFAASILIIMGFHLRLFGVDIPPQP